MESEHKTIFERRKEAPLWYFAMSEKWYAVAAVSWQAQQKNENSIASAKELGVDLKQCLMGEAVKGCFGNSLELICKACAIKSGQLLKKTHAIDAIAKDFGIYNDRELLELKYISEFIVWAARYPVPTKEGNFSEQSRLYNELYAETSTVGNFKVTKNVRDFDWSTFDRLWRKAETYLFQSEEK